MKQITTYILAASLLILSGCETLDLITDLSTSVGVATGQITQAEADSIKKSSSAIGKAYDKLTPEQEYYVGRSVAASILSSYKPYDGQAANQYLNTIGQALALSSDMPETFGGWHFLIMDTDEINAFSAPGGLILISRGMLRCCKNETEVAAVLAHEIGHVQHQHGLQAIKKSRWTSALTTTLAEGAKNLGSEELAELTTAFEGSISDITSTMVNSGYARKLESEADATAIIIMKRVGYNPNGLKNMLLEMGRNLSHDERGFAKTHPAPADRIADINPLLKACGPINGNIQRTARFKKTLGNI
jgi:predicted Zn-dependent protease